MSEGQQANSTPSLNLFLVEDEVMTAWSFVTMANELGHRVCATVTTEEDAIEAISQLKPDVIVLDYRLASGGNGLNLARQIRNEKDIPIIFCTAYGESLRPTLGMLSRVHLIGKPLRLECLRRALAWAAGLKHGQHQSTNP